MTEVYRGFTILYSPPPEREWSFRPEPGAKLQSYRSAFQARRAINILLDGESESTPRRDSAKTSRPAAGPAGIYGSRWSDAELRAAIAAYTRLLEAERRGMPLSKREVAEQLMHATGRTRASVERRFQNVSAILVGHGLPRVSGYTPQAHYTERLAELLRESSLMASRDGGEDS